MQIEASSIILNSWLFFFRLLIQRNKRSADGAQVMKRVTKPITASGERPIWKMGELIEGGELIVRGKLGRMTPLTKRLKSG
jgi:hypothetical protein